MKVSFTAFSKSQAQNWVCATMRPNLYTINKRESGLGDKKM